MGIERFQSDRRAAIALVHRALSEPDPTPQAMEEMTLLGLVAKIDSTIAGPDDPVVNDAALEGAGIAVERSRIQHRVRGV